ncbi:hypothetical protein ACHHYP_16932 [Achlya hypogyna]|uniref:Uncharacterized protein n=1 Tax=Achlya hypogyna TaxID=1202772 RepID=A0A1V9ZDS3_ACHHY|nr:hypothetical protein ACHHYP_16932 [Achlya hypogyna]
MKPSSPLAALNTPVRPESPQKLGSKAPSALASFALRESSLTSHLDRVPSTLNKYAALAAPKESTTESAMQPPEKPASIPLEKKEISSSSSEEEATVTEPKATPNTSESDNSSPDSTEAKGAKDPKPTRALLSASSAECKATSPMRRVLHAPSLELSPEDMQAEHDVLQAIASGDARWLQQLLKATSMGHLSLIKDAKYQRTPFQFAAGLGLLHMCTVLLQYGRHTSSGRLVTIGTRDATESDSLPRAVLDMLLPLDACGCSFLHHICWSSNNALPQLLEAEPRLHRLLKPRLRQLDRPDNFGQTPLAYAAKRERRDAITACFRLGCGLSYTQDDVNSVLDSARSKTTRNLLLAGFEALDSTSTHSRAVTYIADHAFEANASFAGSLLREPLHKIAAQGSLASLEKALDVYDSDLTVTDANGWTPLHHVANSASEDAVLMAERLGQCANVQVNATSNSLKTPLHVACRRGTEALEMVQVLVQLGASVTASDDRGYTPLHCAAHKGALDVVKFLVQDVPECVVHAVCKRRQNALHLAAKAGHIAVAAFLSAWDCDGLRLSRGRDTRARTPLMVAKDVKTKRAMDNLLLAASEGRIDAIPTWLAISHAMDARTPRYHRNAMHLAVDGYLRQVQAKGIGDRHRCILEARYVRVVHLLAQAPMTASISSTPPIFFHMSDRFGVTPMMLAAIAGSVSIAKVLFQHPMHDDDAADMAGNSAIHYAYAYGQYRENHDGNAPLDVAGCRHRLLPALQPQSPSSPSKPSFVDEAKDTKDSASDEDSDVAKCLRST